MFQLSHELAREGEVTHSLIPPYGHIATVDVRTWSDVKNCVVTKKKVKLVKKMTSTPTKRLSSSAAAPTRSSPRRKKQIFYSNDDLAEKFNNTTPLTSMCASYSASQFSLNSTIASSPLGKLHFIIYYGVAILTTSRKDNF